MKRRSPPYLQGERFEGTIERIVPGGLGLMRGPRGALLIEAAAPGDNLLVEVTAVRSGAAHATILAILDPGPGRAVAPCHWYQRCGGCDFQHMTYSAQLDAKCELVRDAFRRIGGIEVPETIERFPAPRPFGARARIELHSSPHDHEIGFLERRSHRVVAIDRCLVCGEEINLALQAIRKEQDLFPNSIHLVAGNGNVRATPPIAGIPDEPFWLAIADFSYLVDPAAFFQSSIDLLPELIRRVAEGLPERRVVAWDLFCGVGLFTLPLATHFHNVQGVDLDKRSISNAVESARRNKAENISYAAADVESWVSIARRNSARPDLIVVDPPRTGLGRHLAEAVAAWQPSRLTYVSCDPTALARDARILSERSLQLLDIAIFDLFPQTHHVETVARFAASG